MSYEIDQQQRGMSSGTKVILGCGGVALFCVVLICGGAVFLGWTMFDKVEQVIEKIEEQADAFATRFEAQGYQRVTGQAVHINSDVKQPTVYTVQFLELNADSDASLAVMAQLAEIRGRIDGDLHFYGQSLVIHPDAVITGSLNIEMAQRFENNGTVEGEVVRSEKEFDFGEEILKDLGEGAEESPDPVLKPSPGDVIEPSADNVTEPGTNTETPAAPSQKSESPETDVSPADGATVPAADSQSSS